MKTIYVTWVFHANMQYDRWPKSFIQKEFPRIYRMVVDDFYNNPELKAQVQLSGVTIASLLKEAPELIAKMKNLMKRGQLVFTGTYYSEPVNVCMDGEVDYFCAKLGTDIVKDTFGEVDGFFPQEQSYHPQLPWIVSQLGLKWITIFDLNRQGKFKPFTLKGLDGTKIIGVPSISAHWSDLEMLYDKADDGDLFTFVGDFELPPNMLDIIEQVRSLAGKGKEVQFITISEYLTKFGVKGEEYYTPCSWTDAVDNPAFTRWVTDPGDITIHDFTLKAMADVRYAHTFHNLLQFCEHQSLNKRWNEASVQLDSNALIWDIECPEDFPKIENYLLNVGKGTFLSKAWHYVLWGVNSDARGWYPMLEKRLERLNSLKNASHISKALIREGLHFIGKKLAAPEQGRQNLLIYNPHPCQKRVIQLKGPQPYAFKDCKGNQLKTVAYPAGELYVSETEVTLPDYGYTTCSVQGDEQFLYTMEWLSGNFITNGDLTLLYQNGVTVLKKNDQQWTLGLEDIGPFGIRETHRGTVVHRSPMSTGPDFVKICDKGINPQLRLEKQLDWCIYLTVVYTLHATYVSCNLELEFTKPVMIGGTCIGREWRSDAITYSVKGNPGEVWYDIPFGTIRHVNKNDCSITALRYCLLQEQEGGISIIAQNGSQSFRVSASEGKIGICLGGSTMGTPAEPAKEIIDYENRTVHQINRWEEEVFCGKYRHQFTIHPFYGTWREAYVPQIADILTEPVYTYLHPNEPVQSGAQSVMPLEDSFFKIDQPGIKVSMIDYCNEKMSIRLVEQLGLKRTVTVECRNHKKSAELQAYEIKSIELG